MNILDVLENSCQLYSKHVAKAIGLTEAIVLHQIHYWLKKKTHYRDNRFWTYNTIDEWIEENFPFFSYNTLQRILRRLENKGILIARNYNPIPSNKTKWYTIDYEILNSLVKIQPETKKRILVKSPQNPLTPNWGHGIKDDSIQPPQNPLTPNWGMESALTPNWGIDDPNLGSSISESSSYISKAAEVLERRECERGDSESSPPPRKIMPGDRKLTKKLIEDDLKKASANLAARKKEQEGISPRIRRMYD